MHIRHFLQVHFGSMKLSGLLRIKFWLVFHDHKKRFSRHNWERSLKIIDNLDDQFMIDWNPFSKKNIVFFVKMCRLVPVLMTCALFVVPALCGSLHTYILILLLKYLPCTDICLWNRSHQLTRIRWKHEASLQLICRLNNLSDYWLYVLSIFYIVPW